MNLAPGARVRITGPPGTVIGYVVSNAKPAELPEIEQSGIPVDMVRSIFAEIGVTRVMLLRYEEKKGRMLVFAALTRDGETWFDLQRQALTIEPA